MPHSLGDHLRRVRIDTHHYRLLVAALVLLFVAGPLAGQIERDGPWDAIASTSLLLALLWALRSHGVFFWLCLGLALPALASIWDSVAPVPAQLVVLGLAARAGFFGVAVYHVLRDIYAADSIGEDEIVGAVAAYLLIALLFSSLFALGEQLAPGSVSGHQVAGAEPEVSLLYFSLVTITTLGFGDVTPVAGWARSLVVFLAMTGILYPSMVVARLLSLYSTDPTPQQRVRMHSVTLTLPGVLLGSLIAGIGLPPLLPESGPGRAILALLQVGVLVSAILAARPRRGLAAAAVGLAVCLLLVWDAGRAGVELELLAALIQLPLLILATAALAWKELLSESVTNRTLISAICIYALLGWIFGVGYKALDALLPGSFVGLRAGDVGEFAYFSFTTLTTTGYGEIVPIAPIARIGAQFEAFIGIFFPAVLLARLVTLYEAEERLLDASTSNPNTRP